MHDQVGVVEGGGEELLVALEFQFVRHHATGIRQHSVGGHDDIAVNAERRHGHFRERGWIIPKSSAPRWRRAGN